MEIIKLFTVVAALLLGVVGFSASAAVSNDTVPESETNRPPQVEDNEIGTGDVKEFTYEDLSPELRNWTIPDYIAKNFPCYLSGFDYEDRPIWISEMGKYDMRVIYEHGEKGLEDLEKYAKYIARIMTDSHKWKSLDVDHVSVILDFDGLQFLQYAELRTIRFLFHISREFMPLLESHVEQAVVLNANFVTQSLISIMRPIFHRLIGLADIYGTDKSIWLPQLLKKFPRESLPEWYGGYKNFTPVKVVG